MVPHPAAITLISGGLALLQQLQDQQIYMDNRQQKTQQTTQHNRKLNRHHNRQQVKQLATLHTTNKRTENTLQPTTHDVKQQTIHHNGQHNRQYISTDNTTDNTSQQTTQQTTLHVVPGCSLAGSDLQCSGPGSNIGVNLLTSSKMYHRARTNDASSQQLIPPLITPLTSLTSLTTVH